MARTKSHPDCCKPGDTHAPHPDYTGLLPRLNRAKGQLSGIEAMITENRYCVDILVQLRAAMAALRAIEASMFESHLQHCVASALLSKDKGEVQRKIEELTELLSRRTTL